MQGKMAALQFYINENIILKKKNGSKKTHAAPEWHYKNLSIFLETVFLYIFQA